jgi:osmotically-inducible protein OsmY
MPAIALLVSTVAISGCGRDDASAPSQSTDVSESRSDANLTTAIQGRFYADDLVRSGRIDVDADNGRVTLSGTVETEAVRQRALEIARDVAGADGVRDQIMVDQSAAEAPPSAAAETRAPAGQAAPSLAWITTKIQAAYFISPQIKPWNIDVTTRSGGVVELRGRVEDQAAKDEAIRIAREIDGVARVEDRLRVQQDAPREETSPVARGQESPAGGQDDLFEENLFSDTWLTAKVQSKYYLDDDIRGRDIDVTTEDGVTTLKGTVQSEQERRQVVALARTTDGVRDVRDQLVVGSDTKTGPPESTSSQSALQPIEDTWITTKIQSQYFLDPLVKGHEINVDTQRGVVTLTGTVATEELKKTAEQIARETDGTVRVMNQLKIQS